MFKKLLLSALAVITAGSMYARFLTPEEALARAGALTAASGMSKAPAASSMKLARTITDDSDNAALYIFEGNGNALILSADDVAAPLLGYIDGSAGGQLPPQLEWWLGEYARQIGFLKTAPAAVLPIEEAKSRAARADKAPIPQLLTTVWNQDAPFNNLCPMSGTTRTYSGCVATAASQVMKYFNYPESGTGTISYNDNGVTRTLALDKPFDWANMRDSYNGTYSAAEASAVAYLMQACGYAAQMHYGTSASSAQSINMLLGAKKYLGYNSAAQSLHRDYYSLQQWEDMIYDNLKNVGPVYYSGDDGQAGHAFVCDGYQGDGYFHFNWGWGGAYDGFFRLDALQPAGQGIGGNSGGFDYNQRAFLNFTRPGATLIDIPRESPFSQNGNLSGSRDTYTRIRFTSDAVSTMNTFAYNTSGEAQTLDFGLKAVSSDGNDTYYAAASVSNYTIQPNQGFAELSLAIPNGMGAGTYHFYPVVRVVGTQEWQEYNHGYNAVSYVVGTVSSLGRLTSVENLVPGSIKVSGLTLESALTTANSFSISYTANNPGVMPASMKLTPCVAIRTSGGMGLIGLGQPLNVSLEAGATTRIEQTSTIQMGQGYENYSGEVYLCLIDNTMTIYATLQTTIANTSFTLSPSKFSFVGNPQQAIADDLQFDCSVICTSGNFVNPITVFVGPKGADGANTVFSSEETFDISRGQIASCIVKGQLTDATVGGQYTAYLGYLRNGSIYTLRSLDFTIAALSGVESVADGTDGDITVTPDGDNLAIQAPASIASVTVYTVDGRSIGDITVSGTSATAASLPRGLLLVSVLLDNGTSKTVKLAR